VHQHCIAIEGIAIEGLRRKKNIFHNLLFYLCRSGKLKSQRLGEGRRSERRL
jgi:hypothetical protein